MPNITNYYSREDKPSAGFDPLPAGQYTVKIIESAIKPTKAGTGEMLEFKLEVLDGPSSGRFLWVRLNVKNPNAKAEEIARAEFAAIRAALNVPSPVGSEDLHNIPMAITVGLRKRSDSEEMENVIRKYERRVNAVAAATAPQASAPWKKP